MLGVRHATVRELVPFPREVQRWIFMRGNWLLQFLKYNYPRPHSDIMIIVNTVINYALSHRIKLLYYTLPKILSSN